MGLYGIVCFFIASFLAFSTCVYSYDDIGGYIVVKKNDVKLIAIILARVNSRRLPNKNFRQFFGRPIIEWVIDEVKKSELFDKIVVSTDDVNIVNWNKKYNEQQKLFNVYLRQNPKYEQTVDDVCLEVLQEYPDYNYLCCIYPTAYAVTWQDLCKSFKNMIEGKHAYCFSVGMLNGKYGMDNGGFYWARINEFLKTKNLTGYGGLSYELPMVDINDIQDFAEAKLHALTLPCGRFK